MKQYIFQDLVIQHIQIINTVSDTSLTDLKTNKQQLHFQQSTASLWRSFWMSLMYIHTKTFKFAYKAEKAHDQN